MTKDLVPFVNLSLQHQPLLPQIEQAALAVIQRGDFILGEAVQQFEQAFAEFCEVDHAVGVASGTDAITLGLQACGIKPGNEVIVPANTFLATLIGIHKMGAKPVLVDCDPNTALINLEAASQAITPRTRVILPVHLYGQMVSPQALLDFAATHDVLIFEDAAQAHGAIREGYLAGSIGAAAAFSFYPSKNLGAMGNGGIVVTQDAAIAQQVRILRNYGAPHKYLHTELGTNSRLDTLQAAILQIKLPYLRPWNQERYQAAQFYDYYLAALQSFGIEPIQNLSGAGHVYHLYVIQLSATQYNRQQVQTQLVEQGIQTGIHYPIPCHLQPAFQHLGYSKGSFPITEQLSQQILSLPMYPGIRETQMKRVTAALAGLVQTKESSQTSRQPLSA